MDKIALFETDNLHVGINLFTSLGETYIHDHKSSFATVMIQGRYNYRYWGADDAEVEPDAQAMQGGESMAEAAEEEAVDEESAPHHFEFERQPGNRLGSPVRKPGKLGVVSHGQHSQGNCMTVPNEAFHTVQVIETLDEDVDNVHCATLIFKSRSKKDGPTRVLGETRKAPDAQLEESFSGSCPKVQKAIFGACLAFQKATWPPF